MASRKPGPPSDSTVDASVAATPETLESATPPAATVPGCGSWGAGALPAAAASGFTSSLPAVAAPGSHAPC